MKRGTGKYKGKLPLKCFSCGKIGHFASKCPYAKNSDGEENDNFKPYNNYKNKNRRKFAKKKSLYTKRDNSSSSGDSDSDSDSNDDDEPNKVLFMAISSDKDHNSKEESEDEGEVDLEAELVSALKELKKVKK